MWRGAVVWIKAGRIKIRAELGVGRRKWTELKRLDEGKIWDKIRMPKGMVCGLGECGKGGGKRGGKAASHSGATGRPTAHSPLGNMRAKS